MKIKRFSIITCMALLALSCALRSEALQAHQVTMLVVPARYSVMQVAFDMVSRFSVVLVSYQGDATSEEPLLHAWNGQEWVRISLADYAAASFVQAMPSQAVLVGDEKLLPAVLVSSISSWCPDAINIPSIDTPDLINALSKPLRFSSSDWQWFTARYNLTLTDVNADRRKASWYDRTSYQDKWTPRLQQLRHTESNRSEEEPPAVVTEPEARIPAVTPTPVVEKNEPKAKSSDVEGSGNVQIKPRVSVPATSASEPLSTKETGSTGPGPSKAAGNPAPAGWQEKAVVTEGPTK